MRVSRNELVRTCHKAFEVLGLPAGVDRDAARMITWLETHRLPGIRLLHADLAALRREGACTAELVKVTPDGPVLDARGTSALIVAPAALDLACASAHASARGRAVAVVRRCRHPLYAAALVVQRAQSSACALSVSWSQEGQAYQFVVAEDGAPRLSGGLEGLERPTADACDVHFECVRAGAAALADARVTRGWAPSLDSDALAARAAQALGEGIEVADDVWRELIELAEGVLVAASEQSRLGAGSRGSDND